MADFETDQLDSILNEVAWWFRSHINDKGEEKEV